MELRGNVVLVSSDGLRLETERLRWDAEAQRAWTTEPVTIYRRAPWCAGSGFESRVAEEETSIKGRVRATFSAARPRAGRLRASMNPSGSRWRAVVVWSAVTLAPAAWAQPAPSRPRPARPAATAQSPAPRPDGPAAEPGRAQRPGHGGRRPAREPAEGRARHLHRQRGGEAEQLDPVRRPHGGVPGRQGRTASSARSRPATCGSSPATAGRAPRSAPSTTTPSSAWCSSATRGSGGRTTWSPASASRSTSPRTGAWSRAASRSA